LSHLKDGTLANKAMTMLDSTLKVSELNFFTLTLEPIEQNVHGQNGIFELALFVKDSKALTRFRSTAQQFDKMVSSKSPPEVEQLVRMLSLVQKCSFGKH
jgi:hypothetical protein